ncbi:hypothetical protein Ctob_001127 [Chrysochromulina tobinii]|uniref:PDZ domain-containing protein n=1 Tax=Chrysochromulina tobinii TaxID=1460289 RepID=A0A0M0J6S6_9EUKA|nr:hypothetical protein Ctob_001127 [Chrysochromulina tobinii]|eukprot:KOO22160.1 hypothetical protein Ctob_001127 [Chrysochromulina sp. CCMP291]
MATAEVNDETLLLGAAEAGDSERLQLLIGAGASVNTKRADGSTALLLAALGGHTSVLQLLLTHDADVTIAKENGATPVFAAAAVDAVGCIQLLCAKGANPDAPNVHGVTPLQMAAHKDHAASARVLLQLGAAPTATDQAGNAALHKAARAGALEAIGVLLADANERGGATLARALLTQPNGADKTPVEVSLEAGKLPAALELVQAERAVAGVLAADVSRLDVALAAKDAERVRLEASINHALEARKAERTRAAEALAAHAAEASCTLVVLTTALADTEHGAMDEAAALVEGACAEAHEAHAKLEEAHARLEKAQAEAAKIAEAALALKQRRDELELEREQLADELAAARNELGCAAASLAEEAAKLAREQGLAAVGSAEAAMEKAYAAAATSDAANAAAALTAEQMAKLTAELEEASAKAAAGEAAAEEWRQRALAAEAAWQAAAAVAPMRTYGGGGGAYGGSGSAGSMLSETDLAAVAGQVAGEVAGQVAKFGSAVLGPVGKSLVSGAVAGAAATAQTVIQTVEKFEDQISRRDRAADASSGSSLAASPHARADLDLAAQIAARTAELQAYRQSFRKPGASVLDDDEVIRLVAPPPQSPFSGDDASQSPSMPQATQSQKVGIRFFSEEEARARGVTGLPTKGLRARAIVGAIVEMVVAEGPMADLVARGDRIISIDGVLIETPNQAAEVLRQSEGHVRIGVLPPLHAMDLSERHASLVDQGAAAFERGLRARMEANGPAAAPAPSAEPPAGGSFWAMDRGTTSIEGAYEDAYKRGMAAYKAQSYDEAEALFREALQLKQSLDPGDPQLGVVYNNLAATLEKRGLPREAEALYLTAIAICERRLPPNHPRIEHIRKKLAELRTTLCAFPGLAPPPAAPRGAFDDFVSE